MIAKLIPTDGGMPIPIRKDVSLVGRKSGLCDIVIEHTSISKLHCVVAKTDGLLFVRDLGSTNGTKVNGQRVTRAALLPGDELSFASVRFNVFLGPGEATHHDERTEMIELPVEVVNIKFDDEDESENDEPFSRPRELEEARRSGIPEDSREFAV